MRTILVAAPALAALVSFGCSHSSSSPPAIGRGPRVAFQTRGEIPTGVSSVRAFVFDHFDSRPLPLADSDIGKDFIVISTIDKNMTMLRGSADGSPPAGPASLLMQFNNQPGEITAGDFDGDGDKDIAVLFIDAGTLGVYYNDGSGDFTKKASQSMTVGLSSCGLTAAKLDTSSPSDDLLCCGADGTEVWVFQRSGDQLKTTPLRLVPPAANDRELGFITVADLDGIGAYNEVLTTDWGSSQRPFIVWQSVNGSFEKPLVREYFSGASGPLASAAVDLDGDSINEVIIADWTASSLSVFKGKTNLDYGLPMSHITFGGSEVLKPFHLETGDVDGDGKIDLVVSFWPGYSIAYVRGKGDGSFEQPRLFATSGQPSQSLITNFRLGPNDQTMDIITSGTEEDRLTWLVAGTATGGEMYATTGEAPRFAVTADFNGDGYADVVMADPTDEVVSALSGGPLGRLEVAQVFDQSVMKDKHPAFLTAADLNGNGKRDVVISTRTGVQFLENQSPDKGAIVFQPGVEIALGSGSFETVAADFDRDGRLDLGVAARETNKIHILRNTGNFGFVAMAEPVAVTGGPVALAAGDFDKDGFVDFAVSLFDQAHVDLFTGDGKGGFTKRISVPVNFKPHTLRTADFDRNGYTDLVVSSLGETTTDTTLNVLMTKPDTATRIAVDKLELSGGPGSTALFAGDIDRDNNADIVSASFHGPDMFVWLGNGNGTFADKIRVAGTFQVHTGGMGDINGDGLLDIIAASASEYIRGLSVYLRVK